MKAVLRYLGAKNRLASWVISQFPESHAVYVEPFGGSGAVLMNKPAAEKLEVYNDLYGRVVNFFRVLRDRERAEELIRLLELTPYAEEEYKACYELSEDPVEDARRLAIVSMMSYGAGRGVSGFRRGGLLRHTSCLENWRNYPDTLRNAMHVLSCRNVEISCTDALKIMSTYDSHGTLFYIDPPYPVELRSSRYVCEFDKHEELLRLVVSLKGKCIVSSYANPLYDKFLSGWTRLTRSQRTAGAVDREEVLWRNF